MRFRGGRVLGFLCWTWLLLGAAPAEEKQPPRELQATFKKRTELVLVPVVVSDKSGTHVARLGKDRFTVLENGREQKIAIFEEVTSQAHRLARTPSQAGAYTNMLQGADRTSRLTIIALDTVNTPFLDMTYARDQVIKYLQEKVETGEPTALITIHGGGIKVIHDFTTDTAVLIAAIKKIRGELPLLPNADVTSYAREVEDLQAFAGGVNYQFAYYQGKTAIQYTLQAFQRVAQAFAGIPGRKSLIWATAGLPFDIGKAGEITSPLVRRVTQMPKPVDQYGNVVPGEPMLEIQNQAILHNDELRTLAPMYERTFEMLNNANVAVYPVDARGLVVYFPGADQVLRGDALYRGTSAETRQMLHDDQIATMKSFAEMTGGRAFYNRNDLAGAFREAAQDSSSYYLLGFYREPSNDKPGWRKLSVKVQGDGLRVRARNGYFVGPDSDAKLARDIDLAVAMDSPLEYTALPMTVRWMDTTAGKDGKKRVGYQISLPGSVPMIDEGDNNRISLDFAAVAKDAKGKNAGQSGKTFTAALKPVHVEQIREEGLNYNGSIEVAPGQYRVQFAVRDNLSGRMGTVSAPLKVE